MQTIFKVYNTQTKTVKEYNKPEFGDFGEVIMITKYMKDVNLSLAKILGFMITDTEINGVEIKSIIDKDCILKNIKDSQFYKDNTHELNTIFNGLYKDFVYSSGDWVGVLQHYFEYQGKVYKHGDIFKGLNTCDTLEEEKDINYKDWSSRFRPDYSILLWNKYRFSVHPEYDVSLTAGLSNWGENNETLEEQINRSYKATFKIGNLLDEYFAGGNELAKLFN